MQISANQRNETYARTVASQGAFVYVGGIFCTGTLTIL